MLQITNEQGIVALDPNTIIQMVQGHCVAGSSDLAPAPGAGDMEVEVDPGTYYLGEGELSYGGGSVTLDTGDTDPRKDLITIETDGSLSVYKGTPAATRPSDEVRAATWQPSPVDASTYTGLPIAEVWVATDATAIQSADIRDRRVSRQMISNTWVQALSSFAHDDSFSGYPLGLVEDTEAQNYPLAHGTDTDTPASAHHTRPAAGTNLQDDADTFNVEQGEGSGLDADLHREHTPLDIAVEIIESFEDDLSDYSGSTSYISTSTSDVYHGSQSLQIKSASAGGAKYVHGDGGRQPSRGEPIAWAIKLTNTDDKLMLGFGGSTNTPNNRLPDDGYGIEVRATDDTLKMFESTSANLSSLGTDDGLISSHVGEYIFPLVDWRDDGTIQAWLLDDEGQVICYHEADHSGHDSGYLSYGLSNNGGIEGVSYVDNVRLHNREIRYTDGQVARKVAATERFSYPRYATKSNVPTDLETGSAVWVEDEERYYYEDGN